VVDVHGAAAPWEKLKKVLKKATAFFNFQFNNSIIRGLVKTSTMIVKNTILLQKSEAHVSHFPGVKSAITRTETP